MLKSETSYLNNVFSIGDLNIVNIHIKYFYLGKDKISKTVTNHLFSLVHIINQKDLITCLHLHQNALSDTL